MLIGPKFAACLNVLLGVLLFAFSPIACKEEPKEDRQTIEPAVGDTGSQAGAPETVPPEAAVPTETVQPQSQTAKPTKPQGKREKTANATSPKGPWSVQVIAFRQKENALSLVQTLTDKGYDAYTVEAVVEGKSWHRVRVGHLATEEEARVLRQTLKTKEGFQDAFLTRQKTEKMPAGN